MNVVRRCLDEHWTRVAFIGIAKHSGKTTALNAFIEDASALGRRIGVCSIGLDGEKLDTVSGVRKPPIILPEGTLVASAESALSQSEAEFEWLEELPVESPLGSIMLARVIVPGATLLAGVRQRQHVRLVLHRFAAYGVDFSLVDGAFDRVAAAAPGLVDAAVLAVGAVSGRTVDEVVRTAYPTLQKFSLPSVSDGLKSHLLQAHECGMVGAWTSDGTVLLPPHQAMLGLAKHPEWPRQMAGLYLPGALTDSLVDEICAMEDPLEVVIGHPAQSMTSGPSLRKLFHCGHTLSVWLPLPLAGLAVNPHNIFGSDLPARELQERLSALVPDIPVYNALERDESLHA